MKTQSSPNPSLTVASQLNKPSANNGSTPSGSTTTPPQLRRAIQMILSGRYQEALDMLRSAEPTAAVQNSMGVCLMRMQRVDDALAIFRKMALEPGGTHVKSHLPAHYQLNYATALVLSGLPSGCAAVLANVADRRDEQYEQLDKALRQWSKSLPLLRRLDWLIGHVAPPDCEIPLDQPYGRLDDELAGTV